MQFYARINMSEKRKNQRGKNNILIELGRSSPDPVGLGRIYVPLFRRRLLGGLLTQKNPFI